MYEDFVKAEPLRYVNWERNYSEEELLSAQCGEVVELLTNVVTTTKNNFIKAGYLLKSIQTRGYFKHVIRGKNAYNCYGDQYVTNAFEKFCAQYMGLGKTTLYGLIGVYDKFGKGESVMPEYVEYNYSQLVEMKTLVPSDLEKVKPEMTVRQIRALKKKGAPPDSGETSEEEGEKSKTTDVDKMKNAFKKMCKNFFENEGFTITYPGQNGLITLKGQAFGARLFDYLHKQGFFDAKDLSVHNKILL